MIDSVIKTTSTIIEEIEYIAKTRKIQYIDAVILWCEFNNHEIEFAGELIKKNVVLRSKIQLEAETLNFMKKSSRLPI
jgi:hypothetical protein